MNKLEMDIESLTPEQLESVYLELNLQIKNNQEILDKVYKKILENRNVKELQLFSTPTNPFLAKKTS